MKPFQLLLLAMLLPGADVGAEEIYPGYQWQEVRDGIYLHSSVNPLAGPVDGNSVVIVNDENVVVIDTHINPAVTRAVIERIQQLTDNPVTHVVNTHFHDDHTNGNHAYRVAWPGASIVSHRATLAALKKEWAPMEEQRIAAYAGAEPRKLLDAADALEDPHRAIDYRVYAGYVAALKPELATMQLVYPDTVFDDELVLHSARRPIVITWLGRGNTDGDVLVWLPEDKLLITGDLVVAPVPFAFDSPMLAWVETLGKISAFGAETIIPGHGTVQHDPHYLERVVSLLKATLDEVRAAHDNGTDFTDLASTVDLKEYERRFTEGDPERSHAWQSYYLEPGLKSAWISLGYPVPDPT